MRHAIAGFFTALILSTAPAAPAHAAEEDTTARLRELLHRTQEALRQAQSDNAELTRAKVDAEQKLQLTTKQIDSANKSSKAAQTGLQQRLQAEQQSAEAARKELQARLDERTAQLSSALDHQRETSAALLARQKELDQVKQDLVASREAGERCEAKNLKLYGYAEEALQRYKNKGVWASLAQKEPVLGLKEVEVENVLQEYQLKIDDQKVKP